MAISLVQTSSEITVASGTSGNVALAGVTAGNLLVIVIDSLNNVAQTFSVSDDKSNSWQVAVENVAATNANRCYIGYVLSAASGTTTITVTSNNSCSFVAKIQEWSGGTWTLDVTSSLDEAATTTHKCSASGAVDTTGQGVLVANSVVDTGAGATFGTFTVGAGWSQISASTAQVFWQSRSLPFAKPNVRGEFVSSNSRATGACIAAFLCTSSSGDCWWPCCTPGGGGTPITYAYVVMFGETPSSPFFRADVNEYIANDDAWLNRTDGSPARSQGSAATINSKIYHAGGSATSPSLLVDNDEYDPATDAWASKADMPSPARLGHAGMAVGSYVYAAYGNVSGSPFIRDLDEYDPSGDSWASKTDGTSPGRTQLAATGIGSYGYAFGGFVGGATDHNEQYDPSGDSWASKANMPGSYNGHGAFTLSGLGYTGNTVVFEYDPSGDSWSTLGTNASGHTFAASASLDSSSVAYLSGGRIGVGSYSDTHQEYVVDTWTTKANVPTPQKQHSRAGFIA